MAPKRSRATVTAKSDSKPKIQQTLQFKKIKKDTDDVEEEPEILLSESESEIENIPKGKDGKVDYKAMTNILPKDFAEASKHKVFIGAHLSISGK